MVNTKCDICSTDVKEFYEAAAKYKFINFILIVSGPKELLESTQSANGISVLCANEKFLIDYSITGFPTFIVISKSREIFAKPPFVKDFQHIFNHYMLA